MASNGQNARRGSSFRTQSNNQIHVDLPETLKCARCNTVKGLAAFSTRQRQRVRNPDKDEVFCMRCTGQQVVEIRCVGCDIVKHVSSYSKTQRVDPEKARCEKCVLHHVNMPPPKAKETKQAENAVIQGLQHLTVVEPAEKAVARTTRSGWAKIPAVLPQIEHEDTDSDPESVLSDCSTDGSASVKSLDFN